MGPLKKRLGKQRNLYTSECERKDHLGAKSSWRPPYMPLLTELSALRYLSYKDFAPTELQSSGTELQS
jgi:hypothetical protein